MNALTVVRPVPGTQAILLIRRPVGHDLEFQFLASELERAGLDVHFHSPVEFQHGTHSSVPSYRVWITRALNHFDQLTERYERVSMGGLGVGANLALKLAALRSNVAALVLMSPALFCDGWNAPRFLPILARTPLRHWCRYHVMAPYGLKNVRAREWYACQMRNPALGIAALPLTLMRETYRLANSVKRSLGQMVTPSIVMHAREDDVASIRNAEYVIANAGTSDISLKVFENSYHLISMDNDKEAVAACTVEFLRRYGPPRCDLTATVLRKRASSLAPGEIEVFPSHEQLL